MTVALLVLVWAPSGSSAPAAANPSEVPKKTIYRILSVNSGLHVGVIRGGRVHAHARHPSKFGTTTYLYSPIATDYDYVVYAKDFSTIAAIYSSAML